MIRNCDVNEISDGKRYGLSDMAKVGCHDCKGCCDCCKGMGNSIVLDPLDSFRLVKKLGSSFEELLQEKIELHVSDGVILPNLRMVGREERCVFLDAEGRCSIHSARPGFCRIFPLGRIYEEDSFSYILLTQECRMENRSKEKISKWIDTPDIRNNQRFIRDWHYFVKKIQNVIREKEDDILMRELNMRILNSFYRKPYEEERSFYEQFYERLQEQKESLQE